jgi:hypothetical protein
MLYLAPGAWVLLHASHTLGRPQLRTYIQLLMAVNLLWSKSFTRERLVTTIHVVLIALAKVEYYLPVSELDMKLHNMGHLLRRICVAGPLWVTSLFAAEGNWGDCMQWATNRAHAEVSMGRSAAVLQTAALAHAANPEAASSLVVKPLARRQLSEWWLPQALAEPAAARMVQLGGSGTPRRERLDPGEVLEMHELCCDQHEPYRQLWEVYTSEYIRHVPVSAVPGPLEQWLVDVSRCLSRHHHLNAAWRFADQVLGM